MKPIHITVLQVQDTEKQQLANIRDGLNDIRRADLMWLIGFAFILPYITILRTMTPTWDPFHEPTPFEIVFSYIGCALSWIALILLIISWIMSFQGIRKVAIHIAGFKKAFPMFFCSIAALIIGIFARSEILLLASLLFKLLSIDSVSSDVEYLMNLFSKNDTSVVKKPTINDYIGDYAFGALIPIIGLIVFLIFYNSSLNFFFPLTKDPI